MIFASIFSPFLDNEIKTRITSHSCDQLITGNNIRFITVSGVQITNWIDINKQNHHQLITVENIYDKKVVKSTGELNFKWRLFYAIIPNNKKINSYNILL